MKKLKISTSIILYILLAIGAVMILIPLWFQVSTSLKPYEDVFIFPPDIIPRRIQWRNYSDIFLMVPFGRFIMNSMIVSTLSMTGQVITSAVVGYGFARLRFPGRNILFMIMISTMMIPFYTILIPQFVIFRNLGWLNTYLPLVVPGTFGVPLYIFLYRQFFINIPREYGEAAAIDGCGFVSTFLRIILPSSLPVIGVVAIMSFTVTWNDFLGPLIYISDMQMMTVQLGVRAFTGRFMAQWHLTMAASVVALIPVVIIFAIFQRQMIQGVVVSGIKG